MDCSRELMGVSPDGGLGSPRWGGGSRSSLILSYTRFTTVPKPYHFQITNVYKIFYKGIRFATNPIFSFLLVVM